MAKSKSKKKESEVIEVSLDKAAVPLSIVFAGLIIAGAVFLSNRNENNIEDNNNNNVAEEEVMGENEGGENELQDATTNIDDDPIKGDIKEAKVAVVEFSDYQCPFCKRHVDETIPPIVENYVETGKAIYVYRDYPLDQLHPFARQSAVAANCAREQGDDSTYYEYHDELFAQGSVESEGVLKEIAEDLALNMGEFSSCLESGKFDEEIEKDISDAEKAGLGSTPNFVVGTLDEDGNVVGKAIVGAYPYETFERVIEDLLAN